MNVNVHIMYFDTSDFTMMTTEPPGGVFVKYAATRQL